MNCCSLALVILSSVMVAVRISVYSEILMVSRVYWNHASKDQEISCFLFQCIDCLSLYPHSLHDLDVFADNDPVLSRQSSVTGSKLSQIIYGNDIDSVDVAIRASLVKFFMSPNVVGDFVQHCRILRLYPRPLVAFQKESFILSRQTTSDFVRQLAETQVCHFRVVSRGMLARDVRL